MPIKGLTDRGMGFPEIGTIRKGGAKTPTAPGRDLTYFRVEFDEREVEAANQFRQVYGAEPKEINILLPFNEVGRNWDAWYEAYTAGRMVARADGEKYIYRVDTNSGEVIVKNGEPFMPFKEGEVIGRYKSQGGKVEDVVCKPAGRLKVVIPELQRMVYLTVLTGSIHDIIHLSEQLEALRHINNGQLAGIPMVLRRRPKKISTPKEDGTRARYTKWMLSIEADPDWVKRMLMQFKHLALPGNNLALLPPGEHDTDETEMPPDGDETEPGTEQGEYHEGQFEEYDEPEPEPEPAPEPVRVIEDTPEVKAAKKVQWQGKKLDDFGVDELQVMIENPKIPDSPKKYMRIVKDSKVPVQPTL